MQKNTKWDVVVIGGGPAGMMAAGRAAERGLSVLLLEKNPTLGKKLLITGEGRCNITNNKPDVRTMLAQYKKNDKFLFSAFAQHGVTETLDFFHSRGLDTKEEAEGRMFPTSDKAKSVWDVLVEYMSRGHVTIRPSSEVTGVAYDASLQQVEIKLADKSKIHARSCIVASGGTSRPETGSTGDGFKWLQKCGHIVAKNNVALVPIALKDSWTKKVSGTTLGAIKLTTYKDGVRQKAYKGKLLFTHVGISGPTVLNMSKEVGELLYDTEGSEYIKPKSTSKVSSEKGVTISLDLFPALDVGALREKLQLLLLEHSNKKIKNTLSLLIPARMIDPILMLASIASDTPNHSLRSTERKTLVSLLKVIPLHVAGLLGKDKAVVSSGGVSLHQINFKTMQSRIVPHIYVVGDMLNIDRPSGGYSLQLCWTTGYIAGNSC